ncbi:MAG TPA: carbohydrate kinase family protein [Casimicrobiaceae bacterium]|jgi:adenosine kinase|nr:carbohydrate kinase family protein [Casimicrobiaceae bacterium]
MRTLICGSLAFDTIMVFRDRFARHILPEQTHTLSVAFQVSDMRREWGGCAGNIAYNLHAIGGDAVVMGTLGRDGTTYQARLNELGIASDGVLRIDDEYTAQAFIITDLDDNQITAFHPGAMNLSERCKVSDVADVALGIVAPDGKAGMQSHATDFAARRIPFLFDPGQGLPLFSRDELGTLIEQATYVAVNDYEGKMLSELTALPLEAIAERVDALIVTHGAEGSTIHARGETYAIAPVTGDALVDPTGCGDAYRAGLLHGIASGWDWQRTGQLASVLGSIKIASRGGQNHAIDRDIVAKRYRAAFGDAPW